MDKGYGGLREVWGLQVLVRTKLCTYKRKIFFSYFKDSILI